MKTFQIGTVFLIHLKDLEEDRRTQRFTLCCVDDARVNLISLEDSMHWDASIETSLDTGEITCDELKQLIAGSGDIKQYVVKMRLFLSGCYEDVDFDEVLYPLGDTFKLTFKSPAPYDVVYRLCRTGYSPRRMGLINMDTWASWHESMQVSDCSDSITKAQLLQLLEPSRNDLLAVTHIRGDEVETIFS